MTTQPLMSSAQSPSKPYITDKGTISTFDEVRANTALVDWVHSQYQQCKKSRAALEQQWYLNMAFYYGNQNVVLGSSKLGGKLVEPKAPPWRTKLVINRIRAIIRKELSKVTSQKPSASVVPASSDDEDLFAAQAGEQIWESAVSRLHIPRDFSRAAWWMLITGNGFLKQWWDGSVVDPANPGDPGDICIQPLTPFHLFVPDLKEEELERQLYVLNVFTMNAKLALQRYRDKLPEDVTSLQGNVISANTIIDEAYLNLKAASKDPEDILIYEIWLKPGAHSDFPSGGMITVVDKYIVGKYTEGIPYAHGEFPFVHFGHIPSGAFYRVSTIEDLIPVQREYNRTRSQIVEAKNRMAKPQLRAPKGSVSAASITSEPGQLIEYRPGLAPPEPIPLQPLPSYVLQELDRQLSDMEDISAQHEVSNGQAPAGVTAATAINYLKEGDDSTMAHTFENVEQGWEKLARHHLSLCVQYWTKERTVRIVGDDGAFDTLVLKGSKIANGQDIRMEGGSSLPTSKAARQAFIMDLMKMEMIPPELGLKMMEIGGVQKIYDTLALDERAAQRENLKMKLMDPGNILDWENQYDVAVAFAGKMQAERAMDPASMGLPGDMPPLPPDFPGAEAPGGPPTGGPGMGAPPGAPPADPMAPADPNMPPAADPQDTVIGNPDGNLQSTSAMSPDGIPLNMPLLVPTHTWDNHAVHIEVHNRFRKSQAFEKCAPEVKRLFEAHIQEHAKALQGAAMGAMGNTPTDALPGGPSGPAPGEGNNQFGQGSPDGGPPPMG